MAKMPEFDPIRDIRDKFLDGLDPSLTGQEYRAGLKMASRMGVEIARVMADNGCPMQETAVLYIFSDILQHIASHTDG